MSNIEVLIIPSWYPTPAAPIAGIFIQQQALALQEAGINVAVLYFQESFWQKKEPNTIQEEGLLVTRSHGTSLPKRIRAFRYLWLKHWDKLFQYHVKNVGYPDLIHAHSFVAGYVAKYLSDKYSIPYCITEHFGGFITGKIPRHWQADLDNIYQHASSVIAVSSTLSKKLAKYTSSEVQIIPNLVNTNIFFPREKNISGHPIHLISVGHLTDTKNQTFLLKTISLLPSVTNFQLIIIGKGPLRNTLQRQAKKLGIKKQVHFTGQLSQQAIADEMRNSYLFVFASQAETFGMVLIEAMACGLPIISTPCGIAEELIQMGGGRIVNTEEEMAKAIVNLTNEYSTFDATHLHKVVKSNYSGAIVAHKIKSLYASLVD